MDWDEALHGQRQPRAVRPRRDRRAAAKVPSLVRKAAQRRAGVLRRASRLRKECRVADEVVDEADDAAAPLDAGGCRSEEWERVEPPMAARAGLLSRYYNRARAWLRSLVGGT